MLKRLLILGFLLPLVVLSCGRPVPEAGERPNLLLVSLDTLRADRLGCYGYGRDTSPHIDAVAEEGVLFENAFSPSPKTTPSHMSMMTGLYPRVHNVYMWDKNETGPYAGKALSKEIPTLAEILKKNGYTNVAFTGGANVAGAIGFGRGFEIYDEGADTGAACRWIRENAGKGPFFLFYHTYYTHDPYLPPPPYDRKYDPGYEGDIPAPDDFLKEMGVERGGSWRGVWAKLHKAYWERVDVNDPADRRHISALYDGCVNYVDNEFVRSLVEALKKGGVLDKTLIVITSDHGEEFLEHGRLLHDSLYGEVTRVPLVMRLPDRLPKGKRVGQIVRNIDILPTVLDLLGLPCGLPVQGVSLLPAVRANEDLGLTSYADFNDYAPPFVESFRSGPWFCLMDQRIRAEGIRRPGTPPHFVRIFNTERDRAEAEDLSVTRPGLAEELQRKMKGVRIESSRIHAERAAEQEDAVMDGENIERLKALGYLREE